MIIIKSKEILQSDTQQTQTIGPLVSGRLLCKYNLELNDTFRLASKKHCQAPFSLFWFDLSLGWSGRHCAIDDNHWLFVQERFLPFPLRLAITTSHPLRVTSPHGTRHC